MSTPAFHALVGTELRRTVARRLVRLLILVAVVGITIAGVVVFTRSSRTVGTRTVTVPGVRTANGCRAIDVGPVNEFPRQVDCVVVETRPDSRRFRLARLFVRGEQDAILSVLAGPLVLAAIFAGASMIGAEWRFGTVGVLLTWEPRRARVMLAKVLAVAITAFCAAVVLEVFLGLALTPAAVWRGTTAGMTADWWRGATWLVARIAFVTTLFGVLGFAIGSLGRNTTAAIGAALVYLLVGEAAVHAVRPGWTRWLLAENVAEVLNTTGRTIAHHGATAAAVILSAYTVGVAVIATVIFQRRDVT